MKWMSFDKKTARFVHSHSEMSVVCNLVHLELPNSPSVIADVHQLVNGMDKDDFQRACREYKINPPDRESLFKLAMELPANDVDAAELRMQADAVLMTDKKVYKYVKGAYRALYPNITFPTNKPQVSNHVQDTFQTREPKPRAVSSGEVTAPRKSGACKLVWDKADELLAELAKTPTKDQVKDRIEQCGETINSSTLSVQFGKWKKSKE